MRKSLLRALIAVAAVFLLMETCFGQDVSAKLSDSAVVAGEPVELRVSTDAGEVPEIDKLPQVPGLTWSRGVSTSTRVEIVNMRRKSVCECVLSFSVEKPGSYVIPPIHVKVGKLKLATAPVSFEAQAPQAGSPSSDESSFAKLFIGSPKQQTFYVGEEIPVEVRVYRLPSIRGELSWPEIDFGDGANVVFKDYASVNKENPKFSGYRQGRESAGGKTYETIRFNCAIRALSPGKLSPSVRIRTTVAVEDRAARRLGAGFDDDFFFASPFARGRSVERILNAEAPAFDVKPLPPPPEGALSLGVVGDLRVESSLTEVEARVGEPLTLRLKLVGPASLEALKAPQLEFSGFRVYPPELEKGRGASEIRYVLIPAAEGEAEIRFTTAVFDTASGEYKLFPFERRLKVGKAQSFGGGGAPAGQVVLGARATEDGARVQEEPEKAKRPNGVLYLKKSVSGGVDLPLWRNALLPFVFFLFAGLAGFGVAFFVAWRRDVLAADPKYARRAAASAKRKEVLKALKDAPAEKLSDVASEKLLPHLADLVDAAPGSGPGELAAKLRERSPELADCLDKLSSSAWAPGLRSQFDDAFKKRLVASFSKLSLLLAVLLLPLCSSFGADAKSSLVPLRAAPATLEEAMTAYDSGDFAGAAKFFKSKLDPARPSPALLYNLGNCLYQAGELPKAMVCYERALRLAPRDSDILENLNLVRRKLDLPEVYRVETPSGAVPCVRDFLRPDEWLCAFALGLALALFAFGLRRLRPELPVWLGLLAAGVFLIALSSVCYFAQLRTSYSPDEAIAAARGLAMRSLPSESSPAIEFKPRPGERLSVLERRGDWALVRASGGEGWMKASDLAFLWRPSPSGD